MDTAPSVLVLGIGNLLWADEGFGVRAVEAFHRRFADDARVRIMDGGTQGIYLVQHIREAEILQFHGLYADEQQAGRVVAGEFRHGENLLESRLVKRHLAEAEKGRDLAVLDELHRSPRAPAAGFGSRIDFFAESSTTDDREAGRIEYAWTTATDASRTSDMVLSTVNSTTLAEAFCMATSVQWLAAHKSGKCSISGYKHNRRLFAAKGYNNRNERYCSPVEGLSVYNTTEKGDYKYDCSAWRQSSHEAITGRSTAKTAAVASVATLTVGSTDASYLVSGNILVTTSGSESFSLQVDFTDEGNTARTATIPLVRIATGGFTATTISASGAVPYPSTTLEIRCKASTAITIKTSGTFTGCTYNVQGTIART